MFKDLGITVAYKTENTLKIIRKSERQNREFWKDEELLKPATANTSFTRYTAPVRNQVCLILEIL